MRTLTRALATLAVVAFVAGACGDDDTAATTTSTTVDSTSTTSTTEPEPQRSVVSVYFLSGEALAVGHGVEVEGLGVAAAAVEALLDGPSADDSELGLSSAIPDGTELLGLTIVDTLATVDLSEEFGSGGGSLSMNARVAQVVYTVTQFPSIQGVRIAIDGEQDAALGGEGLLLDHTFTRADFEFGGDYEHLAPAILVETPRPGDEVSGSVRVSGRSNTFEATLNFEITDADGNVVVEELFAMATSGTGTPGDFDETIPLPDDAPERIVLWAFERSAEDGDRINVVEIPLVVAG